MRPSSLLDRLEPGSYHAKHVAGEALTALVRRRRPGAPAVPLEVRRRNLRRAHVRALVRFARRRSLWHLIPPTVRAHRRNVRAVDAQAAAVALCAAHGHVTYRPDPSCPHFPACERCVRCNYEHHTRGTR